MGGVSKVADKDLEQLWSELYTMNEFKKQARARTSNDHTVGPFIHLTICGYGFCLPFRVHTVPVERVACLHAINTVLFWLRKWLTIAFCMYAKRRSCPSLYARLL